MVRWHGAFLPNSHDLSQQTSTALFADGLITNSIPSRSSPHLAGRSFSPKRLVLRRHATSSSHFVVGSTQSKPTRPGAEIVCDLKGRFPGLAPCTPDHAVDVDVTNQRGAPSGPRPAALDARSLTETLEGGCTTVKMPERRLRFGSDRGSVNGR